MSDGEVLWGLSLEAMRRYTEEYVARIGHQRFDVDKSGVVMENKPESKLDLLKIRPRMIISLCPISEHHIAS